MTAQKDWLNSFIEKNTWSLILAFVGVIVTYTVLQGKVQAQDEKIKSIQEAQAVIVENQRAIIEIQTRQKNLIDDVAEIRTDVKTLLRESK